MNDTTWGRNHGSIRTAPNRFTVCFKSNTATCFVDTVSYPPSEMVGVVGSPGQGLFLSGYSRPLVSTPPQLRKSGVSLNSQSLKDEQTHNFTNLVFSVSERQTWFALSPKKTNKKPPKNKNPKQNKTKQPKTKQNKNKQTKPPTNHVNQIISRTHVLLT